jgi:hypothetical protein
MEYEEKEVKPKRRQPPKKQTPKKQTPVKTPKKKQDIHSGIVNFRNCRLNK